MAPDPIADYLDGLIQELRPVAERLVLAVTSHAPFSAAVKWRQLTFALDDDFDHWICAVSTTKRSAALIFHFGSLLDRHDFDPSDAKFTRRITYRSADDVDDDVIRDVLAQAIATLPDFRGEVSRR